MVEIVETTEISVDEQYNNLKKLVNEYLQLRQDKINRNKKLCQWWADLEKKEVRYDKEKDCICCDHVGSNAWNVWLRYKEWKFTLVIWEKKPANVKEEYSPKIKEYQLDENEGNTCLKFFSAKIWWARDNLGDNSTTEFEREKYRSMWKLVQEKTTGREFNIWRAVNTN